MAAKKINEMATEFIWPIKVYYEDTDAGGVVYYANYLKFFERARSEWLNHLGFDQAALFEQDIAFAVKHAEISYHQPARLNADLKVVSRISRVSGASILFEQQIFSSADSDLSHQQANPLCEAVIQVVSLKLQSFTPCRIPANIKKELQSVS